MTAVPMSSPEPMTPAAMMAVISDYVDGLSAGWARHGKVEIGPNGLEWPDRCEIHPLWRAFAVRIHAALQRLPNCQRSYDREWRNEASVIRAKVREIETDDPGALLDFYRALAIFEEWRPHPSSQFLVTYMDVHGLDIEVDWNHDGHFDADDVYVVDARFPVEWAERVAETYPGEIMDPEEYVRREIKREDPSGMWGAIDALDRS